MDVEETQHQYTSPRGASYLSATAALLMGIALLCCLWFGVAGQMGSNTAGQWHGVMTTTVAVVSVVIGGRWCLFFVLGLLAGRSSARAGRVSDEKLPLVSILVPAYNESGTIGPAILSLLKLDYPRYEIIVVDDGSKDSTHSLALPYAGDHGHCTVKVYRKPNGGKWSALNYAFHRSRGELVLCVDADSRLEGSSLRRLAGHMSDAEVVAVAGQVRVRNRVNLITRIQGLEYVLSNGLIRLAQSVMGSVLVVPGPIGLFRRVALEEVYVRFGQRASCRAGEVEGPFEGDTFAEDFDLSLTLLALGGKIVYEPGAISNTKAPDWSYTLLNQRYRWCRGTIQVLRKYLGRVARDRGLLHLRLMFWLAVTYLVELVVVPVVSVCMAGVLVLLMVNQGSMGWLLPWAGAFFLLNLNSAAYFLSLHGDQIRSLLVLPFYDLYHTFFLNSGWVIAASDEIRGREMRW